MNALVRLIAYRLRFWIKGFAFIQFKCTQQCVCPWAIVKLLLNEFQFRMIARTEDQSKNNNFDSFFLDSNTHAKRREKNCFIKIISSFQLNFFMRTVIRQLHTHASRFFEWIGRNARTIGRVSERCAYIWAQSVLTAVSWQIVCRRLYSFWINRLLTAYKNNWKTALGWEINAKYIHTKKYTYIHGCMQETRSWLQATQ